MSYVFEISEKRENVASVFREWETIVLADEMFLKMSHVVVEAIKRRTYFLVEKSFSDATRASRFSNVSIEVGFICTFARKMVHECDIVRLINNLEEMWSARTKKGNNDWKSANNLFIMVLVLNIIIIV